MKRFDAFHLPRIAQLIQRSNQFNLTTRRYSQAECEAMMGDERGCVPLYVRLSDKFGDTGLISVVILKRDRREVMVDTWLMSCRVLGRGVEQFAMNYVVAWAKRNACDAVVGVYIPTAKNAMVKGFYKQFGFEVAAEGDNGETTWRLDVASYRPPPVHMRDASGIEGNR